MECMGVVMTIIVTAGIIFKSRDMTIRAPTVRAKNSLPVRRKELNDPLILFMIVFLSFMGNSISEFSTAVPRQFQNIFADTEGKKAISGKVTNEKSIYV